MIGTGVDGCLYLPFYKHPVPGPAASSPVRAFFWPLLMDVRRHVVEDVQSRRPYLPLQAAICATAPERLEEVPVLEERPSATRTRKVRHSDSGPGNCGHPGERDTEYRCVLEEQFVQQVKKEKHPGEATKEQEPKNRGPAIQIMPRRLERKTGRHPVLASR